MLSASNSCVYVTEGKAIPVQAWTGPECPQEFQTPRFHDSRYIKVVMLSVCTGRLYSPRKYSRYSFLLEAESTPGPQFGRKDYVNEKFSIDTIGNRTCDLLASSAVPQPMRRRHTPSLLPVTVRFV